MNNERITIEDINKEIQEANRLKEKINALTNPVNNAWLRVFEADPKTTPPNVLQALQANVDKAQAHFKEEHGEEIKKQFDELKARIHQMDIDCFGYTREDDSPGFLQERTNGLF